MRKLALFLFLILLPVCLLAAAYQGAGKAPAAKPAAAGAPVHVTVAASELKWTPLFLGLESAVVSGDPDKQGSPFIIRLRAKTAASVAPHWHPVDENLTVLAGTFNMGVGDKFDAKGLHAMTTGTYSFMPKNMRHFATFAPGTVMQVHGMGPFVINFVNPAVDPRKAAGK
jgi:quercetin dioxygenase-like cupin family protein